MTTQTRTHNCSLCNKRGAEHTPDGINYFCQDATECLDRAHAYLEETNYQDATPEMYELFKAREAQVKTNWENSVNYSQKLFTVLGLDDTTFLTHLEEMKRIEEGN
jgi:hypothetical protein